MFVRRFASCWIAVAAASLVCASVVAQSDPPTAFTYQGVLQESGSPVGSQKNFVFRLFDAPIGGTQFGTDAPRQVTPENGVFAVSLDFGAAAWASNTGRWLEIEVDGVVLNPRERLEPTPFALNTRGITVTTDNHVGIQNATPTSVLHMGNFGYNGDNWLSIATQGGNQFRAGMKLRHFSDGYGWTVESDERFPGLYVHSLLDGDQNTRLFVSPDSGYVGIGTVSPSAKVEIREDNQDGTGLRVFNSGFGIAIGADAEVINGIGLRGTATGDSGVSYGVYGQATGNNSWGVFSNGRIGATGTKSFAIDHPLNPEEWILLHYSSEAPEPLNTYSGSVTLNEHGQAIVSLPAYFEKINTNVRYQLTPIGAPAPNLHVATRVMNNRFEIAGGLPGLEVSWQVIAKRNDRFVKRHGAPTEVQKLPNDYGSYLAPHLFDGGND